MPLQGCYGRAEAMRTRINRLWAMRCRYRWPLLCIAIAVALLWAVGAFLRVELGAWFRRIAGRPERPACHGTGDVGGNAIGCHYCGGEA